MRPVIEDIDKDGDLVLRVGSGSERREYRVDSHALRRASPVFKAMLFGGPWIESKPADASDWVVALPEDDPSAFQVLLLIVHCQFAKVSTAMASGDKLYDLFILCDKYGMTALTKPWAHDDFGRHPAYSQQSQVTLAPCPKTMFIAWEFGGAKMFRYHIHYLVHNLLLSRDKSALVYRDIGGNETPLREYRLGPLDMEGE
ncbi:hypothetical protein B0T21DRAFT_292963 [Apiosordaria backusii]|uniref:BTB domain-containing protein n=1 Tax=Apiosordaria backusii TaxID=314023 RepID=A0AA40B2H5_9PEZI|nr:hypothetical protein B0T21DRAFT_292963 [Apiosordaria backusii]